jgi:hypothetical protein
MHAGKRKKTSDAEVLRPRGDISYRPICCFSRFIFGRHCSRSECERRRRRRRKKKGKRKKKDGVASL